jgi:F-type H+-transporting ATPase subunit epsilon
MLQLEIVTPYGQLLSENVTEVVIPAREGEIGVLPGHVPLLTLLDIGKLTFEKQGRTHDVFLNSGYAEIARDKVTILAESAEMAKDIDLARAESAKKRAEKRLKEEKEKIDFVRVEASLRRALIRIQIAHKHINI